MEFFLAIYLNGQPDPIYPVKDPFPTQVSCNHAVVQAWADPRGKGYVRDVRCERHRKAENFRGF